VAKRVIASSLPALVTFGAAGELELSNQQFHRVGWRGGLAKAAAKLSYEVAAGRNGWPCWRRSGDRSAGSVEPSMSFVFCSST
jgi:hypothetical protein